MIQHKPYNQFRAMMAITRASLQSIFRSPSAVAFSFAFPLFFILVFGFIGGGGVSVKAGIAPGSDTTNVVYTVLEQRPEVKLIHTGSLAYMREELEKGRLDGILDFRRNNTDSTRANLSIALLTSRASMQGGTMVKMLVMHIADLANISANPDVKPVAEVNTAEVSDKAYKSIDFILPGMLGFSLLSMGVFGTAFVFLNLRNTLVIKRFFATPVHRLYIVLGEALSRVLFALLTSSFIIILGYFAFGFTLQHGIITLLNMLILAFIGLAVFMGFGFIISSVAKNESAVPPLANLITMPQFILCGTFFPSSVFPDWLQPLTKALPLTYLNDALRKVAFEGQSLLHVWADLLVLGIWGVVVYAIATRLFKWE
jgi:ABC-2 type transport system permease protein